MNDGSSTNWPATKISSVAAGAVASAIADIDGDGDLDFVSASDGDDHIRWYRHRKIHRSAKFAPAATVGSFGGPSSATVADMDGDGLLDVVGAAVNDDMVVWWESQLDSGSCPPTCWSEHLVDDSLDSNSVAAADLDGDGDDDLVTAAFYHGKVTWWQNDGPCTGTGGACSWPAGTIAGSLPSAWAVHAADINSDGDIDVLGTAVNTDNGVADVVYWENDGYWTGNTFNASWTMVTLETSFNGARGVHAADIDGDGDLDVIAASSADDTIKWWENLGGSSPSWDDHTVDSTFDGAWDVHAADLNGDTFVDIIGVAYDGTSLTWWENSNGAGIAWYDHPVTNAFLGAWSVSAADLDADGDTDVLGVAEGMNTVSWFANTGDCGGDGVPCSSWITDTLSSAASAPMSAVPADIDRDGKPDVIAALRGDGDVVWWENRGGEFALPTTNTSPENGLTNQAPEDLLKIEAHHRGVAGDVDIELESFELLFEEAEDDPLTTLEANAIISETYIYLDDGSGAFEAASDTLVVQIDDLALDENGVQSVQFSDNESDVRVQQGSPRTYFVVVWLTDADPLPDPNMFRVTHLTESSSTGANRETDEDVELEYAQNTTSRTVPVTLSYFLAQPLGADVEFEWGTLTEVGNVGFNLYEKRSGEWRRINEILIGTAGYDSLTPLEYTYRASGVAGTEFVIEDVDSLGSRTRHGPFRLGEFHGSKPEVDPIDWPSIRAEQEVRARARIGESLIEVQHELDANAGGLTAAHRALETGLPLGPSGGASSANTGSRAAADGVRQGETLRPVELWVSETGLHRVRYEDLVAAGIDVGRLPLSSAQITHRGRPVPIRLSPTKHDQAKFGPETYVEFYGQAADSLYTSTSVYVLEFVPGGGARVITERKPFQDGEANAIYVAQEVEEDDREYSFGAPNGDPWYAKTLLAFDKEVAWTQTVEVSDLADGALPATLDVGLWGVTNFPSSPDHHIVVEVNGQRVADEWFDGLVDHPVSVELPPRVMREGENVVRISAPGDTGAQWDMTAIDHVSVEYPRRTVAREGALTFEAAGPVIRVDGLPSDDIVVYRHPYPRPVHVTGVRIAETSSGFSAEFNGPAWPAAYTVAAAPAVLKPSIVPARQTDLTFDEPADYVVIAHPSFLFGVQPLVKARREQGYQVRVVDVEDLYAHYTGGEIDPQAIGDYIAESHRRSGTRYVLLVGGDTYDYHDNLGLGSVSFIPSIYAQTGPIVRYAPADPKYGDVDGDGVPEVAIGRFPVRTTEELASLVDKTLVYGRKDYGRTALFAADAVDPAVSFTDDSELFVSELPAGWRVSRAYLDRSEVGEARDVLLSAVNDGVSLTSFIGHSGLTAWTFDGLFSAADAAKLTNSGRPTVAVQWGCWNNYHVAPQYNTMGHKLLLAGDKGAAAVLGAATLTRASSDQALGQLVSPLIAAEGVTIGDAVLTAKTELAQTLPDLTDVLLGWTLLGDPTLVVEPAGQ